MNKYDYGDKLPSDGTTYWAYNGVKYGSKVLEFGCSNGLLTRNLVNEKGCIVDIVEIDNEAGMIAMEYANRSFIGECYGDIEKNVWFNELFGEKYDVIIFLDVIEHLKNPSVALKQCYELLNEHGTIYVSVPNIAHNSVIINLINNKFEYNQLGILDDTHLRFFAKNTLDKLVNDCGYTAIEKLAVRKPVGKIEINGQYSDIENDISRFLQRRELGEVFQFMYKLKKKKGNNDVDVEYMPLVSCLYFDLGNGFTEENKIEALYTKENNLYKVKFILSGLNGVARYRWDPFENQYSSIKILSINANSKVHIDNGNYLYNEDDEFFFDTLDPYFYISSISIQDVKEIEIVCNITFTDFDSLLLKYKYLLNSFKIQNVEKESLHNELMSTESNLSDVKNKLITTESNLSDVKNKLITTESNLNDVKNKLITTESNLNDVNDKFDVANNELESVKYRLNYANEHIHKIESTLWWKARVLLYKILKRNKGNG